MDFIDYGNISFIRAEHNRKCDRCDRLLWTGWLVEACAWCGIESDSGGDKPLEACKRREILLLEYKNKYITDTEKIKIMAIILGSSENV
jgi:hypothetical protein